MVVIDTRKAKDTGGGSEQDAPRALLEALAGEFVGGLAALASHDFFEAVLNALPFAVVVFDRDHRYRFCNPAAINNPEIRAWIIGKDDFEYCAYRGYDTALAETRRQCFLAALEQRELLSFEEAFVTPQGETLHHWRHMYPVFEGDEFQMAIGYSMDITERKRAEAALERLNQELEARVQERTRQLELANEQLALNALKDGMTGLYNRTAFDDYVARQWASHRQSGAVLSLLLCDVDHFKLYNDSYGHLEGDACLRRVAAVLQAQARHPSDFVARYGGEEFVILLPGTDQNGAQRVAQNILGAMADLELPHRASPTGEQVTLSIGVCSLTPDAAATYQQLVASADEALYCVKQAGRNSFRFGRAATSYLEPL